MPVFPKTEQQPGSRFSWNVALALMLCYALIIATFTWFTWSTRYTEGRNDAYKLMATFDEIVFLNDDGYIIEDQGSLDAPHALIAFNYSPYGRTPIKSVRTVGVEPESDVQVYVENDIGFYEAVMLYNILLEKNLIRPLEPDATKDSLQDYVMSAVANAIEAAMDDGTVPEPVVTSIGEATVLTGSPELLESYRAGVSAIDIAKRQDYPATEIVLDADFQYQCIFMEVGVTNAEAIRTAVDETVLGLNEDFLEIIVFPEIPVTTAEPCDVIVIIGEPEYSGSDVEENSSEPTGNF